MKEKHDIPSIEETNSGSEPEKKLSRRSVLAKLGLLGAAIYAAPVLTTLSDAHARRRSRSRSKSRSRSR